MTAVTDQHPLAQRRRGPLGRPEEPERGPNLAAEIPRRTLTIRRQSTAGDSLVPGRHAGNLRNVRDRQRRRRTYRMLGAQRVCRRAPTYSDRFGGQRRRHDDPRYHKNPRTPKTPRFLSAATTNLTPRPHLARPIFQPPPRSPSATSTAGDLVAQGRTPAPTDQSRSSAGAWNSRRARRPHGLQRHDLLRHVAAGQTPTERMTAGHNQPPRTPNEDRGPSAAKERNHERQNPKLSRTIFHKSGTLHHHAIKRQPWRIHSSTRPTQTAPRHVSDRQRRSRRPTRRARRTRFAAGTTYSDTFSVVTAPTAR